jgi:hypothetical protein
MTTHGWTRHFDCTKLGWVFRCECGYLTKLIHHGESAYDAKRPHYDEPALTASIQQIAHNRHTTNRSAEPTLTTAEHPAIETRAVSASARAI